MWIHPQFDPVALRVGPLAIHWYGISYLIAFGLFFFLLRRRMASQGEGVWQARDADDVLFFGVLGVVLGGRLGYVLFYKPDYYLTHPLEIFAVWQGGMSFHGGLLGVIAALAWFARSRRHSFFAVTDVVAPCVPIGIAVVRVLGNFVNGELWGRLASPTLPWGMVFPQSGSAEPRHPSQIYQALGEGLLLFVVLWWLARRPRATGVVSGFFLVGYGAFRFVAEYFREPDAFLGLRWLQLSQGQWLCVPMILFGLFLVLRKPAGERL
ncbi:prolipoprotein diacylglyceryl transferase [Inhella gelatinilytica]|uniref:Phosphatidylglycerol--prolipoprotein diacylglyceryl transferase n=1 Tax=Inhella gelatinilytica TaxID=2795030 RepID=A0A931IYC8_9BURK|nr:prolipoprotein diacylglyceryl transferase [Inhella gelatinilytica]MBH9552868.1 prolipoprotein diacylglyceryl transferase [Inhella gelatinilytica]